MERTTLSSTPEFAELEQHRRELTAHCYRMLGSPFEAEDAVQETLLRAWKSLDRFEGRSALRSWLYRIATNVCLDMLEGRERRARPMDLGPAGEPIIENLHTPEVPWLQPVPDSRVADPAEAVASRDTIRLAFGAALQHLPPRQRAVLILCEVLRWQASEVAELLETSVASVNSALQRARATLEERDLSPESDFDAPDPELLERYVAAFEAYDFEALTSLIHEDAIQSMVGRRGDRLQGVARDPGRLGERLARLRAVQAERVGRRLRAVGAAGARALRRADRRADVLPRRGDALPALRPPAHARRIAPPRGP